MNTDSLNSTANDTGSNWCDGESTYGSGDYGTPGAANDTCGSSTGGNNGGNLGSCGETDLGSATGAVSSGDLALSTADNITFSCGTGTEEVVYSWTANAAGCATIDTMGSGADTVMEVFDGCPTDGGTSVGCNDDIGGGDYDSILEMDVTSGDKLFIALQKYSSSSNSDYMLNISIDTQYNCDGTEIGGGTVGPTLKYATTPWMTIKMVSLTASILTVKMIQLVLVAQREVETPTVQLLMVTWTLTAMENPMFQTATTTIQTPSPEQQS